jgi:hypothetical protein
MHSTARPVRRAGRGNGPGAIPLPRPGSTPTSASSGNARGGRTSASAGCCVHCGARVDGLAGSHDRRGPAQTVLTWGLPSGSRSPGVPRRGLQHSPGTVGQRSHDLTVAVSATVGPQTLSGTGRIGGGDVHAPGLPAPLCARAVMTRPVRRSRTSSRGWSLGAATISLPGRCPVRLRNRPSEARFRRGLTRLPDPGPRPGPGCRRSALRV